MTDLSCVNYFNYGNEKLIGQENNCKHSLQLLPFRRALFQLKDRQARKSHQTFPLIARKKIASTLAQTTLTRKGALMTSKPQLLFAFVFLIIFTDFTGAILHRIVHVYGKRESLAEHRETTKAKHRDFVTERLQRRRHQDSNDKDFNSDTLRKNSFPS
ncbi:uncharacterized protein LOC114977705 [Acropora millepora]|uniref:uncharacterized protein LOC114977705 n=1 Tax=Acropora millepora TaxID=45264 RepID=UPI0010FCC460|nr:uncharacterized protein LOC114977705 [Acropora millepora]